MARTMSSLFLMEKLIKLVSTITWYGGPRASLYWKKSELGVCVLHRESGDVAGQRRHTEARRTLP